MSDKKTTEIIIRRGGQVVERIPVQDPICDFCSQELPDEPVGGMFHRSALCPQCWKRTVESAHKYNEEHFLKPCPKNEGLASWIRRCYW